MMVPWTTVPFLSSIETVSLLSFIKNLAKDLSQTDTSKIIKAPQRRGRRADRSPNELHPGSGRWRGNGGRRGGGRQQLPVRVPKPKGSALVETSA